MSLYPEYFDRFVRAGSELPGYYQDRRMLRSQSALPESMYENAYNRSESRSLSRARSQIREQSVSSYRGGYPETLLEQPISQTNPIVEQAMSKLSQLEDVASIGPVSYTDYFRTGNGIVRARITIRKRDNYWQNRYLSEINNPRPVHVIRPRVIIQRPIVYQPPAPIERIPVPIPIYSRPKTLQTIHTYQRWTTYTPPSRRIVYYNYYVDSPVSYSSSRSSRSRSIRSSSSYRSSSSLRDSRSSSRYLL